MNNTSSAARRRLFVKKGDYGYIPNRKFLSVLFTIACFGVSLSIFLIGYTTLGTRKNLWTVIAVLGCLPGAKSAVTMIMFLKSTGCAKEDYRQIAEHTKDLTVFYDLQFTSYEKTYRVDSLAVCGKTLCGYSGDKKCDANACSGHLKTQLANCGYEHMTVKIFLSLDAYLRRLDELQAAEDKTVGEPLKDQLLTLAL